MIENRVVECHKNLPSVVGAEGRTFLGKVSMKAVDPSFREFLAALFAGMLVSIARVGKLRTSFEVFED